VHPIVQQMVNELDATNAFDPAITDSKGETGLRRYYGALMLVRDPAPAWDIFTKNVDALMEPYQPFGPLYLSQYTPELFWRAVPLDDMDAWIKQKVPADMAPQLSHGMESARFKRSEQTLMQKAADAAVAAKMPSAQ